MMYGMKGEWPEDVKKPEEVKAEKEKKPFYKQGKWWLLAAFATLMAVATGYGMWLGSQYVKAVENAAHIIADANNTGVVARPKEKVRQNAIIDNKVRAVLFTELNWNVGWGGWYSSSLVGLIRPVGVQFGSPNLVADRYKTLAWGSFQDGMISQIANGSDYAYNDYVVVRDSSYSTTEEFLAGVAGLYIYYQSADGYTGFTAVVESYEEGYQDGLDTDDVDQEVRIVYNTAIGSYARYDVYIDGATTASYSGRVGSDQHDEPLVTLNRPAGEVWKVVITATSAVHLGYTSSFRHLPPRWPLLTPQLEDNGVYAFPTTWSQVGFYIAEQVDDANAAESWDLRLDPSINQSAIGTYGRGYADGYEDGKEDGDAQGYERGFAEGEDTAQEAAYNRGLNDGNGFGKSLSAMFVVAFQQPFDVMYRYLNFNFLGINFLAIFAGMLTLGLGIYVIKKVM